jgi:hypothetical protein
VASHAIQPRPGFHPTGRGEFDFILTYECPWDELTNEQVRLLTTRRPRTGLRLLETGVKSNWSRTSRRAAVLTLFTFGASHAPQ